MFNLAYFYTSLSLKFVTLKERGIKLYLLSVVMLTDSATFRKSGPVVYVGVAMATMMLLLKYVTSICYPVVLENLMFN